ncbi:NAD(P)H-dependent flavin oxidoreductase [Simkania sp.]|uniref:NAD(P)H-dependent flavin oxidoreductase n=1 Tax=Simkania sp. TaxID=34094 RepID=UPI003B52E517
MLTERLKLPFPLIQAPMAGPASHPDLTAAVSNAGGLGSFGAGYLSADKIREAIHAIRFQTEAPFNLNLFVPGKFEVNAAKIKASMEAMQPYFEEQMSVVIEEKVPVFSFTFGIPEEKWLRQLKGEGTVLIGTATHLEEALALEQSGVDFIVAQGKEAGGHRGTFIGKEEDALDSTEVLVKELKRHVQTPIIAAGGVMNREDVKQALEWGACAVQMGTAFLTTQECPIHPKYRQILLAQEEDNTRLTRAFSGRLARGVRNRFLDEMERINVPDYPIQNALTRPIRQAASAQARTEFMSLWAGERAFLCQQQSVASLICFLFR